MKKKMGLVLLLIVVKTQAQTVETEMSELKRLADNCSASISAPICDVTSACRAFKNYSNALMPDGPAGYYHAHIPDKSMNMGNGNLVRDAVKAATKADKAMDHCT